MKEIRSYVLELFTLFFHSAKMKKGEVFMTQMTHLSHTVEKTEYASKYDAAAKKLVSDKQVLARIVKGTAKEFEDYTIEEIIAGIEKEPEVAVREVYPGKHSEKHSKKKGVKKKDPGAIHGMNAESAIPGEGKVTYDIYFYVMTKEKQPIKIIINIELQRDYYVGYHFGARGVFYGARMLSEQLDKEFSSDNYDDMKKVYSIWICMEAPEKDANTITECSIKQKEIYGDFQGEEKCDFLSVIIIRLSGKDNSDSNNELIDMLTVLLSEEIDAETKKRELETKHGMTMTKEVEGGIRSMCNLGEGLIEKYEKRGEERGLRNLVETCQELNHSKETTILKLMEKYQLERKDAEAKIEAYWKE